MATLTAWMFPGVKDADAAVEKLKALHTQKLINIHDAAVVSWEAGKKKPKTREVNSLKGAMALGGAFWGMLFGLLFFLPLLGLAVGAGIGVVMGSIARVGIEQEFIDRIKERVTPGTSALFLLTSDAVEDRVVSEFSDTKVELIASNLSAEQEARLREAFGEE
jgi:uncharacterized membrane protein